MAEDAHTQDLSQTAQSEELPAKLRVHSLARLLGTTSKRIVDVLAELDGRARSPHSTVDKAEAERVRDLLNAAEAEPPHATGSVEPAEVAAAVEVVNAEPESRLLLETPHAFELEVASELSPRGEVEPAPYLPLFVAPQPVEFAPRVAAADQGDEADLAVDVERPPAPPQSKQRAGDRERNGQHDDERVGEALELRGEHQIDEGEREQEGDIDAGARLAKLA